MRPLFSENRPMEGANPVTFSRDTVLPRPSNTPSNALFAPMLWNATPLPSIALPST
ncbi:hypothetical protein CSX04_08412 [Burkholderia cepacia]|nr:hypothetical protein CSX04_08412 [Burkholderia cepacia]